MGAPVRFRVTSPNQENGFVSQSVMPFPDLTMPGRRIAAGSGRCDPGIKNLPAFRLFIDLLAGEGGHRAIKALLAVARLTSRTSRVIKLLRSIIAAVLAFVMEIA